MLSIRPVISIALMNAPLAFAAAAAASRDDSPPACAAVEPLVASAPPEPSAAAWQSPQRPPRVPQKPLATRRPAPAVPSPALPLPSPDCGAASTAKSGSHSAPPSRSIPPARPPNKTPTSNPSASIDGSESSLPPPVRARTRRFVLIQITRVEIAVRRLVVRDPRQPHLLDQAVLMRRVVAFHAALCLGRRGGDDEDAQLRAHAPELRLGLDACEQFA